MSSINQITAVIVESLLNSPYKGYYKKDYLSVLKTLNSIYQEKQKFEDWMVDDFVNQIVGGTNDLLKRYVKLGKSKECARNMLEHYIYWTYEIENIEDIIKAVFNLPKPFHLLIVDDNSPDKTYEKVKELQAQFPNLYLEIRTKKAGLGTAYIHGFKWALEKKYDFI